MEGFESREQQLRANLAKAQGGFARTVVDLGHDKLEGHLEQVDELVVKSQGSLSGFFGALSQSKQALLDFRQELSSFLDEIKELAAETHGLESLSAASQKLQDQAVEGFANLDGLAEKLLDDNAVLHNSGNPLGWGDV
jgi:phage-related protein